MKKAGNEATTARNNQTNYSNNTKSNHIPVLDTSQQAFKRLKNRGGLNLKYMQVLAFLLEKNVPMHRLGIAELGKFRYSSVPMYVKCLLQRGDIFERCDKTTNSDGYSSRELVTRVYLLDHPNYPKVKNDPREPLDAPQIELFNHENAIL